MKRLSPAQAGHFINGFVFGAFLVILIFMWGNVPIYVRGIMIGFLVIILSIPWWPEMDLRKTFLYKGGK